MADFKSFETFEEMQQFMAEAEDRANADLHPEQIELRDDTGHTRWWVRPYAELGILIFGEAWSAETVQAKEPQAYANMVDARRRGYLFGYAYSTIEPDGEPGDTHVANVMPISEAAFNEAKAHGWRAVAPDRMAALMVPAEVLAQKTTPTLNAELDALDALMRGESGG